MKADTLLRTSIAGLALGSSSLAFAAGSFKEISEHLDLDGPIVAYIDFDGDGQDIGEKLNVIYQQYAEVNPNVPPFPLDFPSMFETLGFGSIRSFGMSSTEVEDGLFRNRSVTLLDGEPAGVLGMYGLDPIEFRSAEIAPADASTVASGRIDFAALVDTFKLLSSQVMGPMGEGMFMQGLSRPVPGTDVTAGEVVTALSGGMDFIMSQSFEDQGKPEMKIWLSLHGAATLLPRLEPLFVEIGITFIETESGRVADLSTFIEGAPFGLFIEDPSDSDELLVYTDPDWVTSLEEGGPRLADTADFKLLSSKLRKDAAFYAYSAGFDTEQIRGMVEQSAEMAPYADVLENAVNMLFGGLLAPSAAATFRDGDAIVTEGFAGYSYKGLVMALPAGIGAGVGAGIAAQKAMEAQSEDWESEDEAAELTE